MGQVILAGGPITTWTYDLNGNVTSETDPLGNTTWTAYNGSNLPISVTDALGWEAGDAQHTTTTTYTELGEVSTVTDPLGNVTTYLYDDLGRKTEEIDPRLLTTLDNGTQAPVSPTTSYGYDAAGNLMYTTDPRGAANALVGTTGANYTTWYFYDGLDRQTCVVDALADATYTSDVTPTSQPAESTMTTYNALGEVATVTQYVGSATQTLQTTTYHYDNLGRETAEIEPEVTVYPVGGGSGVTAAPATTFAYDPDGNQVSTTDPDGHTSWTDYDALNRVVKTVSPQGNGPKDTHYATTTTYDAVGNVLSVTDPDGNVSSYVYDNLNRQIETTDPLHNASFDVYDLDGKLIQSTDADGNVIQYVYNAVGEQSQENWLSPVPPGEGESWISNGDVYRTIDAYYNADGETVGVTEWDATSRADRTNYEYTYDADGNVLTSRMAPGDLPQASVAASYALTLSNSGWSADWQGNGQAVNIVGAATLSDVTAGSLFVTVTSSAFDPTLILMPTSAVTFSGTTATVQNWSEGIIATDSGGVGSAYLLLNVAEGGNWYVLVTSKVQSQGTFNVSYIDNANPIVPTALATLNYTYDADGNNTAAGEASIASNDSGSTISREYDAASDLKQVEQSAGSTPGGTVNEQVVLGYYGDGSLESVHRYAGDGTCAVADSTYVYDADGRLTSLTYSSLNYNNGGDDEPFAPGYTFEYDAAGNVTYGTSNAAMDDSATYSNDAADELTAVRYGGFFTGPNESYTLDQNGNRTVSTSTTSFASNAQTVGADNELLWDGTYSYTYDKDGNRLTKTLGTSGATVVFAWNPLGQLVAETSYGSLSDAQTQEGATQTVTYTYDVYGNRICETVAVTVSGVTTTTYDYLAYAAGSTQPLLEFTAASGLGSSTPVLTDEYLVGAGQVFVDDEIAGNLRVGQTTYVSGQQGLGTRSPNGAPGAVWILANQDGTAYDLAYYSTLAGSAWLVTRQVFDSFGSLEDTTVASEHGGYTIGTNVAFAGMLVDPNTGLQDDAARWYDASVGQFVSPDPSGFAGSGTNLYVYCGNSPVENTDPSGKSTLSMCPDSSYSLGDGFQAGTSLSSFISARFNLPDYSDSPSPGSSAPEPLQDNPQLVLDNSGLGNDSLGATDSDFGLGPDDLSFLANAGPLDSLSGGPLSQPDWAAPSIPPLFVKSLPVGGTGAFYDIDQTGQAWYGGRQVQSIVATGNGKGIFDDVAFRDTDPLNDGQCLLKPLWIALATLCPGSGPAYVVTFKNPNDVPFGCPYTGPCVTVLSGGPSNFRSASQVLFIATVGQQLNATQNSPIPTPGVPEPEPIVPQQVESVAPRAAVPALPGLDGVTEGVGQIAYGSSDLSQAAQAYRVSEGLTNSGRNIAVIEYRAAGGSLQTVISASEFTQGHAERLASAQLASLGVQPDQVTRIYSELQPCVVPTEAAGCATFINNTFPQAKVTWSFEYGATQASRQAGVEALKKAAGALGP